MAKMTVQEFAETIAEGSDYAALDIERDIYGYMKWAEERAVRACIDIVNAEAERARDYGAMRGPAWLGNEMMKLLDKDKAAAQ